MSEKKRGQAIARSPLLQRMPEPMVGTIKHSQFSATKPRAIQRVRPFFRLVVTIKTVAKAVRKDKASCPAYIFGIMAFPSSILRFISSSDRSPQPSARMWSFPIGVLPEYQKVPTTAAITAPARESKMMVVMG